MSWGDNIHLKELSVSEEENINWKNRYNYIKNQIDDLEYILSRIKYKMVGRVYISVCPFPSHNEKTASFTVYPKGYTDGGEPQKYTSFYCYGCGCGGDVIKFKELYEGLESRKEACKLLEKEHDINVNDVDIRQVMLKEGLQSIKNSEMKTLDFVNINRICSGICKDYLNWIKFNFPQKIDLEFGIINKFYKYFDEQILEMNMIEAKQLIIETENIIKQRKMQILQNI